MIIVLIADANLQHPSLDMFTSSYMHVTPTHKHKHHTTPQYSQDQETDEATLSLNGR